MTPASCGPRALVSRSTSVDAMDSGSPRWITAFLDLTPSAFDPAVAFWPAVTGYGLSAPRGPHAEFATLLPPVGDAHLRVQRLGTGPTRVHLDLHVDDLAASAATAAALGATEMDRLDDVVVMASPGGFVFCLVPVVERERAPAAQWPAGHRSALDQVCLDVPHRMVEAERAFWRDLTGWPVAPTDVAGFERVATPDTVAVRLLIREIDDGDAVTGHLDLATDDREAETARHVALGAQVARRYPHWTVLTDPTGAAYCITDRLPHSTL